MRRLTERRQNFERRPCGTLGREHPGIEGAEVDTLHCR